MLKRSNVPNSSIPRSLGTTVKCCHENKMPASLYSHDSLCFFNPQTWGQTLQFSLPFMCKLFHLRWNKHESPSKKEKHTSHRCFYIKSFGLNFNKRVFNPNILLTVTLPLPIRRRVSQRKPLDRRRWQHETTIRKQRRAMAQLFPQQRGGRFTSARLINKRDRPSIARFVYGALVLLLAGSPLPPPLCFLECLEWVLYEKAYLKRTWGTLGSPQQLPSCAPCRSTTTTPLNPGHSKPWHHSWNVHTTEPAATVQL